MRTQGVNAMTQAQKIKQLEGEIDALKSRIALLEACPQFITIATPVVQPPLTPPWTPVSLPWTPPYYGPTVTSTGGKIEDTFVRMSN
jgi:hypothetical protein